ncbi:MAG: thioredoxin domain-containing protein [Gaiellaceae bacterium]
MTSGKKARRQRRTPAPPPVRSTVGRQASPKVIAATTAVIGVAAVAVALAFVLTGGSSSSLTKVSKLPDAAAVLQLFRGIPQHGNVLGSPNAPVTLVEYIDLQCPTCRAFETGVMPTIVPRYVRTGKVKVVARPIAFIGSDSEVGRRAALAAAAQNRFFEFTDLLYFNQGTENSGWLNDSMIRSAYVSIPGFNSATALREQSSSSVTTQEARFDNQANADQVRGTPTVLVGKTGGQLALVSNPAVIPLSAVIDRALRQ